MDRRKRESSHGGRTQRQLKVGEEIRHLLSDILLRGSFYEPELEGVSVTVSEVAISPDLSNASVYILPLGGGDGPGVVEALGRIAPAIQGQLAQRLTTRRTPRLKFHIDSSFDNARRIDSLIDGNNAGRGAE